MSFDRMTGIVLLAASFAIAAIGWRLVRTPDLTPDEDPFGDEQPWVDQLRVYGYVVVGLGLGGALLGLALVAGV